MTQRLAKGRTACVLAVFSLAAVCTSAVLAQRAAAAEKAAVAGKYEGWVRGSSQGDMTLTLTLAQDGDKLTGEMNAGAGQYVMSISDGKVEGSRLTWSFSNGQVSGGAEATFSDGTLTGSWSAAGESGSLEAKRTAAK
jgi:hypothetical protein